MIPWRLKAEPGFLARRLILSVLYLWLCCLPGNLWAEEAQPLILESGREIYGLDRHLEYLADPGKTHL